MGDGWGSRAVRPGHGRSAVALVRAGREQQPSQMGSVAAGADEAQQL
ncbi:hypothetical protein STRIP9103_03692 [Streptomyces ipomoeae 91-03]|uniref:Uncharacterized protein n=1 Tax=Streptomyces ipomoeae 91-03 TaxID=698759 RepID=L1KUQ2_9ACTN|nr:hypothetical protein STRIP9103_03692 [Streptomyces ipomoeae 91-03]